MKLKNLTIFVTFLLLCEVSLLICFQIKNIGDTITQTRILAWFGRTNLKPGNQFTDIPVYDRTGLRKKIRFGSDGAIIALPSCPCKFATLADLSISSANTRIPITILVPHNLFPDLSRVAAAIPGTTVYHIPLSYRSALGINLMRSVIVRVSNHGTILSVDDINSVQNK